MVNSVENNYVHFMGPLKAIQCLNDKSNKELGTQKIIYLTQILHLISPRTNI